MDASVLIPTRGRPEKLARCLCALAGQKPAHPGENGSARLTFEVLAGFDGEDLAGQAQAEAAWSDGRRSAGSAVAGTLRILPYDEQGLIGVRNAMIGEARGEFLVSINDDVTPESGFLATHVAEQRAAQGRGRPAIVVGHSPYRVPAPGSPSDTLLNRLVRETGMVFFYDAMNTPEALADPDRDWGFRHCFGLNFSAPLAAVRAAGGFTRVPRPYGYEDIELAFRLREMFSMPVLYRPRALAEHEHYYTSADILERERLLGRSAWCFAHANSAFAQAVFDRDIRSLEEIEYSRAFVERERSTALRLRESFLTLDRIRPSAITGPDAGVMVRLIAQQHLLLKRWTWRAGLLESAEESRAEIRGSLSDDRARDGSHPAPTLTTSSHR